MHRVRKSKKYYHDGHRFLAMVAEGFVSHIIIDLVQIYSVELSQR